MGPSSSDHRPLGAAVSCPGSIARRRFPFTCSLSLLTPAPSLAPLGWRLRPCQCVLTLSSPDLRGPWVDLLCTLPVGWGGLCSVLPMLGCRQEAAPLCPVLLWTMSWRGRARPRCQAPWPLLCPPPAPCRGEQAHLGAPSVGGNGRPLHLPEHLRDQQCLPDQSHLGLQP